MNSIPKNEGRVNRLSTNIKIHNWWIFICFLQDSYKPNSVWPR